MTTILLFREENEVLWEGEKGKSEPSSVFVDREKILLSLPAERGGKEKGVGIKRITTSSVHQKEMGEKKQALSSSEKREKERGEKGDLL